MNRVWDGTALRSCVSRWRGLAPTSDRCPSSLFHAGFQLIQIEGRTLHGKTENFLLDAGRAVVCDVNASCIVAGTKNGGTADTVFLCDPVAGFLPGVVSIIVICALFQCLCYREHDQNDPPYQTAANNVNTS